jgi:hypothetical protein
MVNNYNLEYELLKKSKITTREPKSIMDSKVHLYGKDDCDCGCVKEDI